MDIHYCLLHLRKTQCQTLYYIHLIDIPTSKGDNSYKSRISKIGNSKGKERLFLKKWKIVYCTLHSHWMSSIACLSCCLNALTYFSLLIFVIQSTTLLYKPLSVNVTWCSDSTLTFSSFWSFNICTPIVFHFYVLPTPFSTS